MALIIKLIRHGESEVNTQKVSHLDVGDHAVALSEHGWEQARAAGQQLGADFLSQALIYVSPYRRTRQTLQGLLEGSGLSTGQALRIYEDPRLREVDHGYADIKEQLEMRRLHGWFYYRFRGGESPADCFDRTSSFLESMMRQVNRMERERVLIVTHGLTIRCFAMRFLHLTVEQFDTLDSPHNCDVITLAMREQLPEPVFSCGRWSVAGLRLRTDDSAPD
jgi:broad specificity phosphatase PhoE